MFLGIDIGTSSVKAVVVDEGQHILRQRHARRSRFRGRRSCGRSRTRRTGGARSNRRSGELRGKAGPAWSGVRAIGLSGQMHGVVLLDEAGLPLRPAILHNDGRAFAEAEELNREASRHRHHRRRSRHAGLCRAEAALAWQHEPEVMAGARQLLLPKDYVRFRMTGSFATDMCDASGALLLDGAKRAVVARDRGGLRDRDEPASGRTRGQGRVGPAQGRGGARPGG